MCIILLAVLALKSMPILHAWVKPIEINNKRERTKYHKREYVKLAEVFKLGGLLKVEYNQ